MTEAASAASPLVTGQSGGRRIRTLRLVLAGVVLALAGTDLALKVAATQTLGRGRTINLGVVDLQLAYNSGAAFSLGAGLPTWLIIGVTGVITAGIAVITWRAAAHAAWLMPLGLAAVLAGAVANLIDRAADGVVTDYLHTGWWPTFNLADVFITVGAATAVLATLRADTARAARR